MEDGERPSKDEYYLGIAKAVCQRSPCVRRQFGAIVVKNDAVVSTGYNGPPRGVINCTEAGCLKDKMDLPHYGQYEYCLPPKEEIVAKEGNKLISEIEVGEKVLTHEGKYEKVTKTFSRSAQGLLRIKPVGLIPIRTTPNHPVFSMKTESCPYDSRILCKKSCEWDHKSHCPHIYENYELKWIPAKELEKNDIVVLPFDDRVEKKKTIDLSFIEDIPKTYTQTLNALGSGRTYSWIEENLGVSRTTAYQWKENSIPRGHTIVKGNSLVHGHSWAKSIPKNLELNQDTLRLVGLYLAEGSSHGPQITFTFNSNEEKLVNEVKKTISRHFGLECYEDWDENRVQLKFTSKILAEIFRDLFGKDCYSVSIPNLLMNLPPSQQKHIIEAHAEGDGYITKKGETRVKTASRTLALQIVKILLRLNIIPTIDRRKNDWETTIYRVSWKENRKSSHRYIEDNYLFAPLREISSENYDGLVYNLEVENSNSYTTNSFAVHNCTAVHAEENAVINAARHGAKVLGGTLYLYGQKYDTEETIEGKPCDRCKRTLINAGIEKVVTKNNEGTMIKTNVKDWVSEDTKNYLKQLEEAKE